MLYVCMLCMYVCILAATKTCRLRYSLWLGLPVAQAQTPGVVRLGLDGAREAGREAEERLRHCNVRADVVHPGM